MANIKCIPKDIVSKLKSEYSKKVIKTPAELSDVITAATKEKYGLNIPEDISNKIIEQSIALNKIKSAVGDNIGALGTEEATIAFIKANTELNNTLKSLVPSSKLDVWLGVIGRSTMLTSAKSFLMNIEGNIMTGVTEAVSRRIASGSMSTTSSKLAKDYLGMVRKVYKETGVDISRMKDSHDFYKSSELLLGSDMVSTQGVTGVTGKIGRNAEKLIFEGTLGTPDSIFGSLTFADSVNIDTVRFKDVNKLLSNNTDAALESAVKEAQKTFGGKNNIAIELMEDSMRLEPKTTLGKELRLEAVNNSKIATLVQDTLLATTVNKIKVAVNAKTKSKIGDFFLPFIKTPANAISLSLDYAGVGAVKAVVKTIKGISNGAIKNPEVFKPIIRNLARSGVGFGGAIAIASQLDASNFIGAYDPTRNQIKELEGSSYDAVKLGDKWYSTDFFGPFAGAVSGLMYAKRGEGYVDKMYKYYQGAKAQLLKVPGVDLASDIIKNSAYNKTNNPETASKDTLKYAVNETSSRVIPAMVGDIAKATDSAERVTNKGILDQTKAKIPGLRQTLPEKKNVFNQPIRTQGPVSTILAGSRVSKALDTPITKEISRLVSKDKASISFTDFNKSTSLELTQFKEKVGPKFDEAATFYGKSLEKQLNTLIKDPRYILLSDAEKAKQIKIQDEQAKIETFKKYGFKYKTPVTKKQIKL